MLKGKVVRPVDARTLVVATRPQSKLKRRPPAKPCYGKVETPVELDTVGGEPVNLAGSVALLRLSVASPAARVAADDQDVSGQRRPFALNAHEFRTEVENQVVTVAVGQRLRNTQPELDCCMSDRGLRDRPFPIG